MLSVLKKIDRYWGKWELALLYLGGVAIVVVMLLTTADVLARNIFSKSILGATELVSLLLLPAFTCALPYIQARRGQIILEFATEHAPAGLKKWLDAFGMAVGIFLFTMIAPKCYDLMLKSAQRGDVTAGTVSYPIWPFRLVLAVVVISMIVRLLLDIITTVITPAKPGQDAAEQS